ncbi:hypothetical protein [Aureispira sp. CCB-QB1]|uniref:hypothetical protein n=1 Tax=Aureispira sp. CCB-QB1 TaxID=1313421 RepID=UPI0006985586|nr:hypothetical protein [Aureispira sp. CCB-QB1]
MKENIQFLLILCLFAYVIFLQQCKQGRSEPRPEIRLDTIVQMDTILPPPVIVQLPRQAIPQPTIIYVDSSKNMVIQEQIDTSKHEAAQLYQDSLEDENLTVYYSAVVDGQLLQNNLDYKLKIPTQITKTIEIPKPVPMPVHSILLTAGVGGNVRSFASVRLGLQFVSAKGWSLGYDYDLLQKAHSVNLGVRLVKFESTDRF